MESSLDPNAVPVLPSGGPDRSSAAPARRAGVVDTVARSATNRGAAQRSLMRYGPTTKCLGAAGSPIRDPFGPACLARLAKKHKGTPGSPRITADRQALGWRVSKNTRRAADSRAGNGDAAKMAASLEDKTQVCAQGTDRLHRNFAGPSGI